MVFGQRVVLRSPGLRMGRFGYGARAGSAALVLFSGLLLSCNSLHSASNPSGRAAAPLERAAYRFEISDNFQVPELEQRFEEVARHAAPSVVAISATDAKVEADDALRSNRINPEKLAAMLDPVDRTVGTGFIVDSDGYIVTNDHVVSTNDNI